MTENTSTLADVTTELTEANSHLEGLQLTVEGMVETLTESLTSRLDETETSDISELKDMIEEFTKGFVEGITEMISVMEGSDNTLQKIEDLREERQFNDRMIDVLERIADNTDPKINQYGVQTSRGSGIAVGSGSGSGSESESSGPGVLGMGAAVAGGTWAGKLLSKVTPGAALKWAGTRVPAAMVAHFAVSEALESAGKMMRGEDASNRISRVHDSISEAMGTQDMYIKFWDTLFGTAERFGILGSKMGMDTEKEKQSDPDEDLRILRYEETRDAILKRTEGTENEGAISRVFEIDSEIDKRMKEIDELNEKVVKDRAYAEEYYKDIKMHEDRLLVIQKERRDIALEILEMEEGEIATKAKALREKEMALEIERQKLQSLRGFMGIGRKFSDRQIERMLAPKASEVESLREEISLDDPNALVQRMDPLTYAQVAPEPIVRPPERTVQTISPLGGTQDALISELSSRGIRGTQEVANILAQVEAESNFNPGSENMNYSGRRLYEVFGSRYFDSIEDANRIASMGPEAIANHVYSDHGPRRNKLGNTEEGDGYRFRGRGMIQLTGRDNYQKYSDLLGVDLVTNPDLANDPEIAAKIAAEYFSQAQSRGVDLSDISSVTGTTGAATNDSMNRANLANRWVSKLERASNVPSIDMNESLAAASTEANILNAEMSSPRGSRGSVNAPVTTVTNNHTTSVTHSTPLPAVPPSNSRDLFHSG